MDVDWEILIADLGPRLFRYFRATCSSEEASDLTQECLLRLVRKHQSGQFDPRRGNLAMYAFGIAHFVRLEARKLKVAHEIREEATTHSDPGNHPDTLEQKQRHAKLRAALVQLPDIQCEILSLMIDEELTLVEIGKLLQLASGTVKSHVHRAKENLRQILTQEDQV